MKVLLSCLLLIFTVECLGQTPPFERIGVEQGLSQGFVTCIAQDREGFIWAGTFNGLNRYDGHRIEVMTHDPFDSLSISGNNITSILDIGDYLLVGTTGAGLNFFHKKTRRFYRVPFSLPPHSPPPSNEKHTGHLMPGNNVQEGLVQNANGDFWMVVSNDVFADEGWVVRMELPKGFLEQLPENPDLLHHIRFHSWWMCHWESKWPKYVVQYGDLLLCFQSDKTLAFDQAKQSWVPLAGGDIESVGKLSRVVCAVKGQASLVEDLDSTYWYCTPGEGCTRLGKLPGQVLYFGQKQIWLRVGHKLVAYLFTERPFKIDYQNPVVEIPVQDERNNFTFDGSGNLWFAETAKGLVKYSTSLGRVQHYFQGKSVMSQPFMTPDGTVAFFKDRDNLQMEGKPDPVLESLQRFMAKETLSAFMMRADDQGRYWLVAYHRKKKDQYLLSADPRTGSVQSTPIPRVKDVSYFAVFDKAGKLWFSAGGYLISYDPKATEGGAGRDPWSFYDYKDIRVKTSDVVSMEQTNDGSWWLATSKGLVRAKPRGTSPAATSPFFDFTVYETQIGDRNSLRNSNVSSLLADPADPSLLWIATKGGGLSRLDTKTGAFKTLTTKDGFPDNVIYGILSDQQGHLWLSSNKGIIRYAPSSGEIKSFRKADGLQEDEFNAHAFSRSPDGCMMFGGVNGLNVFYPKDLAENHVRPKVLLTGLKVNNVPVSVRDSASVLPVSIEFCQKISLPYSQNNLTFEFAALEFTASSKNRYRYHLEGAEAEGIHESSEPQATYLNLPAGSYTFVVYGSNNDGLWSEEPARLQIVVWPPWYRHWLAYLCYLALAAYLGHRYWRMRENQHLLERRLELEQAEHAQRLELEQQEAAHIKEMNQLKLNEIAQRLIEKSKLLEELQGQVQEKVGNGSDGGDGVSLLQFSTILTQEDWVGFRDRFEKVFPGFIAQLDEKVTNLTPAEVRLILLMRMGLTTVESAAMLGISPDTIKKTRYRLRKKLEGQDLLLEELL